MGREGVWAMAEPGEGTAARGEWLGRACRYPRHLLAKRGTERLGIALSLCSYFLAPFPQTGLLYFREFSHQTSKDLCLGLSLTFCDLELP